MPRLSRRTLLRSAIGFGLALPWLEAMGQTATAPRRLVTVFTANGDQIAQRFTTKTETGFAFDDMLSPFEPYRNQLLALEGIDKYHSRLPSGERADGHEQGGSALAPWPSGTGSFPIGGSNGDTIGYVKGPSLEVAIGQRLQQDNPSLRYTNLNFRVGDSSNNIWNVHSHGGPEGVQNPLSPETNPFTAYTRIFTGIDTAGQQQLARRLAMKQSALDLVKADLPKLESKVSAKDKVRLEQHLDAVREIERSLSAQVPNNPSCGPLSLGSTFNTLDPNLHRDVGFLFFRIIAMSFACDLVRTVNFNWSGNTSNRVYSALGMTDGHHDISHDSSDPAFTNIRAIKKHLFQLTTQLFDELKSLDEYGKTVWDHTATLTWSELSQGDTHQVNRDLCILAGGAHGYFRMGRYLDYTNNGVRSFSNLLISMWQYMGYNIDSWGHPSLLPGGTGPLPLLT